MTNRLLRRIAAEMSEEEIINGCSQMFLDAYYNEIKQTIIDHVVAQFRGSSIGEVIDMDLYPIIDELIKASMSANLYKTIKLFCDQNGIPEYTDDNGSLADKIEDEILSRQ